MYRFFSWYNQNRRKFWITLISAIIIILIVYKLLEIINENLNTRPQDNSTNTISQLDTSVLNTVTMNSNRSAISGTTLPSSAKDKVKVIDKFIEYCNSGKIEEAYNLITDDCKKKHYPDLNDFNKTYYTQVFGNKQRNVSITNWIGDTYKIDLKQDILATGRISETDNFQDYYTVVKTDDNNYKLNIKKYIRTEKIEKEVQKENINIKVISKDIYIDYEVYKFEITNNTDKTMILGDVQNINSCYIVDENNYKYNARLNEIETSQLKFNSKSTRTIEIKFLNRYSSSGKKEKQIVFSDVSLYYEGNDDISNIFKIEINL